METRKKTYNKPLLQSEAFVPNEYVAACVAENGETQFYLACIEEYQDKPGEGHTDNGCKRPEAYTITLNENNTIKSIWENSNNSGWWNNGGYATNIKVNGQNIEGYVLDLNGTYTLTWDTYPGRTMGHTGILKLSTAINVNMS